MVKKVAIITGASPGIEWHTAIALSAAGWHLILTARRLPELQETRAADSDKCLLVDGDIADEVFVEHLFDRTIARFGSTCYSTPLADFIAKNAGRSDKSHPIEEMPLELFMSIVNVDLVTSFLCTRGAFRVFKARTPTGGRIINDDSLAAHVPRPHSSAYACSKYVVSGLSKSCSIEGCQFDISVTQIDIGNAHTIMTAGKTVGTLQPDGRWVVEPTFDPVHVAQTIVHIASLPNSVTIWMSTSCLLGYPVNCKATV